MIPHPAVVSLAASTPPPPDAIRGWALLAFPLLIGAILLVVSLWVLADLRRRRRERELDRRRRPPRSNVDPWFEAGMRADPIDDDAEFEEDDTDPDTDSGDIWEDEPTGPEEDEDDTRGPERRPDHPPAL